MMASMYDLTTIATRLNQIDVPGTENYDYYTFCAQTMSHRKLVLVTRKRRSAFEVVGVSLCSVNVSVDMFCYVSDYRSTLAIGSTIVERYGDGKTYLSLGTLETNSTDQKFKLSRYTT